MNSLPPFPKVNIDEEKRLSETANLMTAVPVSQSSSSSSSSSSLLAVQSPPLSPEALTSILQNFCPLMESKQSDDNEGTFIYICGNSSDDSAIRLKVQEMKASKDPKTYQKFQPKAYVRPANDYVNFDGGDDRSPQAISAKDFCKEKRHSPRGHFFSKTKFEMSKNKQNSFAAALKSNSSSSVQHNKYFLKPMPFQSTSDGDSSSLKNCDISAISATASMPEVRDHIERIFSLHKPITSLSYLEPFKALTILAAKTIRLILNHEQKDGFEELKAKVFDLIAAKLPATAMEQYEKLYDKQSLRSFLGFLCNFIQDKIPSNSNNNNSRAALCFKCFKRGHWLDRCRGEPLFSSSFFDFESNNGVESDVEEEDEEDDDDEGSEEEEEEEEDSDEDDDDDEDEKRYYQPLSSVLPAMTKDQSSVVKSEPVSTAELKMDANGFYIFN